jgi:hypothetical protein
MHLKKKTMKINHLEPNIRSIKNDRLFYLLFSTSDFKR